jgi:hypothetical protein
MGCSANVTKRREEEEEATELRERSFQSTVTAIHDYNL